MEKSVIKETVYETLTALGFNVKDPLEVQAEMLFVHRAYKLWSSVVTKVVLTIAALLTAGLFGLVVTAVVRGNTNP